MFPVFFWDLSAIAPVEIESLFRAFHRLQVAERIGVHAERQSQDLAVEVRFLCEQLLVDADGQRHVIAKNLELVLQALQQVASFLGGGVVVVGVVMEEASVERVMINRAESLPWCFRGD